MQTQLHEQLSRSDAEVILLRLPERIRTALVDRAAEIEYPILSETLLRTKQLLRWRSRSVSGRESLVFLIPKLWDLSIVNQDVDSKLPEGTIEINIFTKKQQLQIWSCCFFTSYKLLTVILPNP